MHRRYLAALYRCDGQYHTFATPKAGSDDALTPVTINPDGWEQFEARIEDVKPDGTIILARPDGSTCGYAFKEVAFVL